MRELPDHVGVLAAFYPGVIDGVGGIFFSTSSDGFHWTRAVRLLESPHDMNHRTRDYPVDGRLEAVDSNSRGLMRLAIEHRLDLRMEAIDDEGCPAKPYFCIYELSSSALLNASYKANLWKPPMKKGLGGKRFAKQHHVRVKPPAQPVTILTRLEATLRSIFLRPQPQKMLFDNNETLNEVPYAPPSPSLPPPKELTLTLASDQSPGALVLDRRISGRAPIDQFNER